MRIDRRLFLAGSAAALAGCNAAAAPSRGQARFAASPFRRLTDEQWRRRLSPLGYRVLREEHTERSGTSPLNGEKRRGTYVCAGCALPLFRSEWKFESGTGWPSFHTVIRENIGTKRDLVMLIPRTEYHCGRCLGHQGHVFDDGPEPTGKRFCINSCSLDFKEQAG